VQMINLAQLRPKLTKGEESFLEKIEEKPDKLFRTTFA
jgi:hypothetical protein